MINKPMIGESDFKNTITEKAYYVDKSMFINEIFECSYLVILLPRPRRFGKTLNLSMFKYFVEKSDEDRSSLFEGLAIYDTPVFKKHFGKYPTIFLTFKDIKVSTWDECHEEFKLTISKEFANHKHILESGILSEFETRQFLEIMELKGSNSLYRNSLKYLSEILCRYYKQKVVILIDEYDTPIHTGYLKNYYEDVVSFIRNLLSGALKDNPNLFKGVITGTLRVSKESIFTGLNNIGVFTLLHKEFDSCFGFTKDELEKILTDFDLLKYKNDIIEWYDGYNFGGNTIFNPWSVLNFILSSEKKTEPYWLNTSSMDMIETVLLGEKDKCKFRHELISLLQDESIVKVIDSNIVMQDLKKPQNNLVWSFLLYSGYLKPIEQIPDDYDDVRRLKIPNMEVKIVYRKLIKKWFTDNIDLTFLESMLSSLKNGDMTQFETALKSISMKIMSYYDFADDPEKVYHALVLGMLVWLSNDYEIHSNREVGLGRYDLMFKPKDLTKQGIIIEFKKIEKTETPNTVLLKALKQIDEKKYDTELKAAGVNDILKLAIGFKGKEVFLKKMAKKTAKNNKKKGG